MRLVPGFGEIFFGDAVGVEVGTQGDAMLHFGYPFLAAVVVEREYL